MIIVINCFAALMVHHRFDLELSGKLANMGAENLDIKQLSEILAGRNIRREPPERCPESCNIPTNSILFVAISDQNAGVSIAD